MSRPESNGLIDRPGGAIETLPLSALPAVHYRYQRSVAPAEPHAFEAELHFLAGERSDVLAFRMAEPADHRH